MNNQKETIEGQVDHGLLGIPSDSLKAIIKTQSVQIKKQKLTIEILVRIVDELRRPYMDGPQHDLYLLGTDGLNQLENLEVLP